MNKPSCPCTAQVDISTEVGVVHDIALQELRLSTDFGRTSRPLFIVDNQSLLIKKKHIVQLQHQDMDLPEDQVCALQCLACMCSRQ